MPFNGTGTYAPAGADYPVVTLTVISSTHYNNVVADQSTAISNAVTRDGQSPWTANLPAGGFKVTNMGAGTLRGDSVRAAEVQDNTYLFGGTAGGTANALTLTLAPAITAYVTGQIFMFKSGAAINTTAATMQINGIATPKAIQKDGLALVIGDIEASKFYFAIYDGTAFQLEKLSPTPQFTTGDVKFTIKAVADAGWVLMNDGTIGNAASAGTTRANADTEALFTLLWNNTANAQCAVSTGRGANAAADFAANKNIALPKTLGRALAASGAGAGLTARVLALANGVETKTVAAANLPASGLSIPALSYSGSCSVNSRYDSTGVTGSAFVSGPGQGNRVLDVVSGGDSLGAVSGSSSGNTGTGTTGNMGSGTALDIMNPMQYLNVMVKL